MTKILDLPDGSLHQPGDQFPAVRAGVTHKVAIPPEGGSIAVLNGIPDTLTLDTKATVVNYDEELEKGLFVGNVDALNGVITVPTTGVYTARFLAIGTMASPSINQTSLLYYRLANAGAQDGDYLVAVSNINSNSISNASWAASVTRSLPIGAEITVVLEGSTNLGLFTFVNTTLEVHLVS